MIKHKYLASVLFRGDPREGFGEEEDELDEAHFELLVVFSAGRQ